MQENRKKEVLAEIARRFEVPERKAKLARYTSDSEKGTKSKMNQNAREVYCICKTSDIERFMIMCDECEEWFHGDCIKITEKEANNIKYFYCKDCRTKNPFLRIKYRKNKKKEDREALEKKHQREKKKLKLKKRRLGEANEIHKSASAPLLSSKKDGKYEKDDLWQPEKITASKKLSAPDKSILKIYSSDSDVDVSTKDLSSETVVKKLKHNSDRVKSSSALDILKEKDKSTAVDNNFPKSEGKKEKKKESKKCGKCENCLRKDNCGLCDVCFDREKYGSASKLHKCRLRRCLNKKSSKNLKTKDKSKSRRKASQEMVINSDDEKILPKKKVFNSYTPQNMMQNGFSNLNNGIYGSSNQCFGPGCTKAAILPSKYCSDECGRRLARNRLYQILPQRIQEWNGTPTVANEQGKSELDRIHARMEQARNELQALEQKYRKLESIISAGKSLTVNEKRSDAEDENEGETDHLIYCVVCGHSVSLKSAIKHMDKCYIKIESQMSFGSVYPTKIEGSKRLFCDVYNEQQQTYCKRLQVLCPEHTKEPKVTEDDVCGCPFSCDIYGKETPTKPSHFCRLAKRKCNKHFKWETMYRAEVDLQRIRQWLKIDEIFDEERRIKTAMANRAGVVSLLLHQTTVHDPRCVDMRTKPTVTKKPAYRLMI